MATLPAQNVKTRQRFRQRRPTPLPMLKSVSATLLFGKYSFDEFDVYGKDIDTPNICLLYGENGIGKTTLMKLIYAALTDEYQAGLKGYIAQTIFARFQIKFSDGQTVTFVRHHATSGSYDCHLAGVRQTQTFRFHADPANRVLVSENSGINEFVSKLCGLAPHLVFISDIRSVRSSNPDWNIRGMLARRTVENAGRLPSVPSDGRWQEPDAEQLASAGLERLLAQGHDYLRDRAIRANALANAGIGQIYASIARTLFQNDPKAAQKDERDVASLVDRITDAQNYIDRFGDYTLLQGEHLTDLLKYVVDSSGDTRSQIYELIEPYVISIEKRIKENRPITDQIYAFENGINQFLRQKSLNFKVSTPAMLFDDKGGELSVANLSSGERHLLYIMCISMLSRDQQAIVLIDEPELSLNYKWQRRLISSILGISSDKSQFIMATHSFEIIASFRDATVELEPRG